MKFDKVWQSLPVTSFHKVQIWSHLGWRDLRILYGRSRLGPLWSVATLGTSVAGLVLAQGVLVGEINFSETAPRLATGLWIWFFFSSIVTESTVILDAERNSLLNSVIDESVFITKVIWKHIVTMALSFPIVLLLLFFSPNTNPMGLLPLIPLILVFSATWLLPISLLARYVVAFPDLKGLIPPSTQMLFFFSPIIWSPSSEVRISEILVNLNPVAWLIVTAQSLTSLEGNTYSFVWQIVLLGIVSVILYSIFLLRSHSIKSRL